MPQEQELETWIKEKYISVHALPNEAINAWIKWDKEVQFDNLILRSEKDVYMHRFLNVTEEVFKGQGPYESMYLIDRKYLEAEGFFGFQCFFTPIPSSDHKITFNLDFIRNNESIAHVEFTTTVIVPDMRLQPKSDLNVILTELGEEISLELVLEKVGTALVRNLRMFINVDKSSKDMDIQIESDTQKESVLTSAWIRQRIMITGSGYALIRMGFEYEDVFKNKYKTNTVELILNKRVIQPAEIPIRSRLETDVPLIMAR